PAAVPVTATRALSNALLPVARLISSVGIVGAFNADPGLKRGVTVAEGRVVDAALARETGRDFHPISSILPLHEEAR
ncbi:MAG: alanine dehydrogenase, partial [Actinomycetota bacterium]|nr:alanine dehydrogenase [Actinomycetota bacterium]